jgi:phosphoglycerate dehydrogenase-like enzyme
VGLTMAKVYFIVPSEDLLPSAALLDRIAERDVVIEILVHMGKLADLRQLETDTSEKVLAIDPDFCDWDLDVETLKSIPGIRGICLSTTSFDYAKPDVVRKLDIPLINVPGFNADSVAEYALCMAIETARRLPLVIRNNWQPVGVSEPILLRGKTAGVVGLGRVGTSVAEVLQGIGMNVVYWSRKSQDDRFTKVALTEVFSSSDLIVPALAVNEETKQLISNHIIDSMSPTAIMVGINRVRELWDEGYVIRKVQSGDLGGYAYEGAETAPRHEGNVWALPHISWMTKDSMDNLERIWTENILAVLDGTPQNLVG